MSADMIEVHAPTYCGGNVAGANVPPTMVADSGCAIAMSGALSDRGRLRESDTHVAVFA